MCTRNQTAQKYGEWSEQGRAPILINSNELDLNTETTQYINPTTLSIINHLWPTNLRPLGSNQKLCFDSPQPKSWFSDLLGRSNKTRNQPLQKEAEVQHDQLEPRSRSPIVELSHKTRKPRSQLKFMLKPSFRSHNQQINNEQSPLDQEQPSLDQEHAI